jgi:thioredoxin reductase (NADPH)
MYDLIIIGGGPGGLTAGIYAKRAAINTLLIEMGLPGGEMNNSDRIENYPGFTDVGGSELSEKFAAHAGEYGLEIRRETVTGIDPGMQHHEVRLSGGDALKTHTVIMATGGNPRKLQIPGESEFYGKGVSYCAVCDGFFFKDRTVVVIGGGDSAAEESLFLSKIAKKVYIVHRRDELRAGRLLQQRVLADCNIEVLWNTIPTAINADDMGVNAVQLKDTKTGEERELPTEGAFIFIGFEPNNGIVPVDVKMNADGYVITDEKCETSVPGIYAIGDLREKYARQIVIAAADGCTAALAAAHYAESKKAEAACELPE